MAARQLNSGERDVMAGVASVEAFPKRRTLWEAIDEIYSEEEIEDLKKEFPEINLLFDLKNKTPHQSSIWRALKPAIDDIKPLQKEFPELRNFYLPPLPYEFVFENSDSDSEKDANERTIYGIWRKNSSGELVKLGSSPVIKLKDVLD